MMLPAKPSTLDAVATCSRSVRFGFGGRSGGSAMIVAAFSTPATDRRLRVRSSANWLRRSAAYVAVGRLMPNVTTRVGSKPASTDVRFLKLRTSSAAPITSMTASATSATRSDWRTRLCAELAVLRMALSRTAAATVSRFKYSSGGSPKIRAVRMATAVVTAMTRGSITVEGPAGGVYISRSSRDARGRRRDDDPILRVWFVDRARRNAEPTP